MKIEGINNKDIRSKYNNVIAWGTGAVFKTNFVANKIDIDFIIDGTEKDVGKCLFGYKIFGKSILHEIKGRTLIVIYTVYEKEVIDQLLDNNIVADYLLYTFVRHGGRESLVYAKSAEDVLVSHLAHQACIKEMKLMEIGVCHPIIRNNTFSLYTEYSDVKGYKGVLVEPNPLCWDQIEEYRKRDILIKKGVVNKREKKQFFMFPNHIGHSTFSKSIAERLIEQGKKCVVYDIDTVGINELILDNFENGTLDVLSVDAEGMDTQIITDIDFQIIHISIIIVEKSFDEQNLIDEKLLKNGYYLYAQTMENAIWTNCVLDGY